MKEVKQVASKIASKIYKRKKGQKSSIKENK